MKEEYYKPGEIKLEKLRLSIKQCFKFLDALGLGRENLKMFLAGKRNKIYWAIVSLDSIKMMYHPSFWKLFTVNHFPNKDMLKDIATASSSMMPMTPDINISLFIKSLSIFPVINYISSVTLVAISRFILHCQYNTARLTAFISYTTASFMLAITIYTSNTSIIARLTAYTTGMLVILSPLLNSRYSFAIFFMATLANFTLVRTRFTTNRTGMFPLLVVNLLMVKSFFIFCHTLFYHKVWKQAILLKETGYGR